MKQKNKEPKEIRHLSRLIYDSSHLSHEARNYKNKLQSKNKTPEFAVKAAESEDRFIKAFNKAVATISEYGEFKKMEQDKESEGCD